MVIFVTNQKENLPKTILSRFRIFETEFFNQKDIELLVEKNFFFKEFNILKSDLFRYLTKFSGGSPREVCIFLENALCLDEKSINFETENNFLKFITILTSDIYSEKNNIFILVNELLSLGCNIKDFLLGISFFIFNKPEIKYFKLASKIEYITLTYNYLSGYAILGVLLNNGDLCYNNN